MGACMEAFNQWMEEAGLPETVRLALALAVDELLANILSHAYRQDRDRQLSISARCAACVVELTLGDDGPFFDPTQAPQPDLCVPLEQRHAGGLGLWLVRHAVDHVSYRRFDNRNELTLRKSWGDASDAVVEHGEIVPH